MTSQLMLEVIFLSAKYDQKVKFDFRIELPW